MDNNNKESLSDNTHNNFFPAIATASAAFFGYLFFKFFNKDSTGKKLNNKKIKDEIQRTEENVTALSRAAEENASLIPAIQKINNELDFIQKKRQEEKRQLEKEKKALQMQYGLISCSSSATSEEELSTLEEPTRSILFTSVSQSSFFMTERDSHHKRSEFILSEMVETNQVAEDELDSHAIITARAIAALENADATIRQHNISQLKTPKKR